MAPQDEITDAAPRSRLSAGDRREQILAAAREVFLRQGLAGTRVRELSSAAGVNEALLYRHFESKEALFEAAVAEPLAQAVQQLISIGGLEGAGDLSTPDGRRENLETVLSEMIDTMLDLGPMLGVILFAEPERASAFYRERFLPAIDSLAEATAEASRGWARRDSDARLVVLTAVSTCLMVSLDHRFGGNLLANREHVVKQLARDILEGLEPRER